MNKFQIYNKVQKKIDNETFEFQGKFQKLRAIEFSGFSGDLEKDNQINKILKFIKELKKVKLSGFVINSNEIILTDEMKYIFF